MANFVDGVVFTAASAGTGNFVVNAPVTGAMTPSQAGAVGGLVYRYRAESLDLTQWEIGYGVYTSGTVTVARTVVLFNSAGTTAKINFTSAPNVGLVPLAMDLGVRISSTAPASPQPNDLWWDDDTGLLYIYYAETAGSSQWVAIAGGSGGGTSLLPADANPLMDGAVAIGSSLDYAREDHVHPSDTSRVAKAGDTMTGNLTIDNADPGFVMNKAVGVHANIFGGNAGGVARWYTIYGNYDVEGGANSGSNWVLNRYSDGGVSLGQPIVVYRDTGNVLLQNSLLVGQDINVGGQAYSPLTTLTDGSTISVWDCSLGQKAKVTLGAAGRTMPSPTNVIEGATYYLWVIQDGTGGRTITTWNAAFDFGAAGAPTLSAAASKADMLCFEALNFGSGLKLRYMGIALGFS